MLSSNARQVTNLPPTLAVLPMNRISATAKSYGLDFFENHF